MPVYDVQGAALQDASNLVTWAACCRTDGEIDTGATSCVVTLYKFDGSNGEDAVSDATESVTNPTARGIFNGSMTVNLTPGALYYYYVTMTVGGGTREGWIPIGVPVRTA